MFLTLVWPPHTPLRAGHIYRFAGPGIIDLSRPAAIGTPVATGDIPRQSLAPDIVDALAQRPDCGADGPWQLAPLAGDKRHARTVERQLLSRVSGSVHRAGPRLSITPARGTPIVFDDWTEATTRRREGDSETFVYAGQLTGSHYHRVEVRYGHDAPGSFLVHPTTGTTAYAHNGGQVVALAPGGARLAVFETLNAPYPLVVAALDAHGPRVEVRCRVDIGPARVTGAFCGWHDAASVAVRFTPASGPPGKASVTVARLTHTDGRWHLMVGDYTDTVARVWCHEVAP